MRFIYAALAAAAAHTAASSAVPAVLKTRVTPNQGSCIGYGKDIGVYDGTWPSSSPGSVVLILFCLLKTPRRFVCGVSTLATPDLSSTGASAERTRTYPTGRRVIFAASSVHPYMPEKLQAPHRYPHWV
ncbi:hypothetical protein C8F04DRAFT_1196728 [Mycena alexandri]|uniref:Uncharacterized protein n=1 Tax=Mycena alexandri TaxID=1745969 RepID=A0AAD6S3T7_9AGAR|nr:hypothetical protein C8F04DRAFT_1196728 [Mycena alexandri]